MHTQELTDFRKNVAVRRENKRERERERKRERDDIIESGEMMIRKKYRRISVWA